MCVPLAGDRKAVLLWKFPGGFRESEGAMETLWGVRVLCLLALRFSVRFGFGVREAVSAGNVFSANMGSVGWLVGWLVGKDSESSALTGLLTALGCVCSFSGVVGMQAGVGSSGDR